MLDGERAVAASPLVRGVSRARAHQWRVAVDVDASRYAGVVRGDDVSGCLRPLVTPESVRRHPGVKGRSSCAAGPRLRCASRQRRCINSCLIYRLG